LGENIFDVGSAFVGGAGAARIGTRAAGEAADAADAAAQGVRAAGALDNAVTDTSAIAGRAGSISDKLDDLGDNIPTGAAPNATGPAVPRDLVEPPSAPRIPEAPVSRAPEAPTPVDRSPSAPNSSTQTSTPPHTAAGAGEAPRTGTPPAGEMPESSVPAAVETRSAPLEGTRAPFESRPIAGDGRPVWSNHENASPDNGTHNAGGDSSSTNDYDAGQSHDSLAPDGRIKFSGHGSYDPANGEVAVPSGTSVTFYAEHGAKITDALGNLIETGGDASRVYSRTFYPGEIVPNYTLHPPEGLIVHGSPYTVEASTQLSSILRDNMGDIDFAACLYDPTAPLNRVFDVDGIYDETDGTFTHIYEKAEDQNGFDDEHFEYEQSADNDHTQPYYGFGQDEYTDSENWDYDDIDFDEF
jgi:hypothetical protein